MFEVKNLLDQYDTNKVDQVSLSQFKVFFIMFYNSLPQLEDDQMMTMIMVVVVMGCTQIPISTLSHIWVFVRLYGIVFVIIVIIVIIIIMIIKSEGVNAQL